jgi:hypothetical protein
MHVAAMLDCVKSNLLLFLLEYYNLINGYMLALETIIKKIKNIQEDIGTGNFAKAEKKILEIALFFTDQIKKKKLVGDQLSQVSDSFFTLFEVQLEKKFFSPEIENLLYHCFNLHTFISKENYQEDKKFLKEIEKIENLAQDISGVHGRKDK